MASRYFQSRINRYTKISMLLYQKKMIEQHFSFLKCRMEGAVLVCKGIITSPDHRHCYKVEVRCVYGNEPYVKIIEPASIEPSVYIHMYDDHSLCLHYPPDMKWHSRIFIYEYTIPWLIEWTLYYELYLFNGGKWEGPESPVHITQNDKNISEDL